MHFDHADTLDVVERVGLVATEALIDPRLLFTADHLVHHFEVHHVMARRRLVALRAFGRFGTGVQVPADFPVRHRVAACAIGAEEPQVLVAGGVTGLAIEGSVTPCRPFGDALENLVIHPDRTERVSLMLDMAATAFLDVDMESGRRLLQDFRRSCVAGYAGLGLDAPIGGMATLAFALEKSMRTRQRPRTNRGCPLRQRGASRAIDCDRNRDSREERDGGEDQIEDRGSFHDSHRRP